VIEGSVQRFEERATIGAVIGVGDEGGCVIEPLVAPGIVAGKHPVAGFHVWPLETANSTLEWYRNVAEFG